MKFLENNGLKYLLTLLKGKFDKIKTEIDDLDLTVNGDGTDAHPGFKPKIDELDLAINGDGTDAHKSIDQKIIDGDFINLAPKIGFYQEEEIPLQGTYSISHMNISMRGAPVVTKDNVGRTVLYFIGNGGGPEFKKTKLHKAYKEGDGNWIWYNSEMNIATIHKDAIYNGIYGCDNTYLILYVTEPTSSGTTDKFYMVNTGYNFDEREWTVKDITSKITVNGKIPNSGDISYKKVIHIRYFKEYNTMSIVYQTSYDMKVANWYYILTYKCNSSSVPTTKLSHHQCKGLSAVPLLYSDTEKYIYPDDESIEAEFPSAEGGACTSSVLLFEEPIDDKNAWCYMSIIIPSIRFDVLDCTISETDPTRITKTLSNDRPLVYALGKNVFKSSTSTADIGLSSIDNNTGDTLFLSTSKNPYTNGLTSTVFNDSSQSIGYLVDNCNNSSYNTEEKTYYRITMSSSKGFRIITISDRGKKKNDDGTYTYFNGVIYKDKDGNTIPQSQNYYKGVAYTDIDPINTDLLNYTPDASLWGKRFYLGTVLWDKIFINSRNSTGEHLLYCDADKWQFLTDSDKYPHDRKIIEPKDPENDSEKNNIYFELKETKVTNFKNVFSSIPTTTDDYKIDVLVEDGSTTTDANGAPIGNEKRPVKSLYSFPVNKDIRYRQGIKQSDNTWTYIYSEKILHTKHTKRFNIQVQEGLSGISSSPTNASDSSGAPQYYKAAYDPIGKKIRYYDITHTNDKGSDFTVTTGSLQTLSVNISKSDFNTGDADNTFIYPGFVAYNPLVNKFFMFGILDYTTVTDAKSHVKIPHLIGINKSNGAITRYTNQNAYKINYAGTADSYPPCISSTTNYYTPLLPFACTVINKRKMVVYYMEYNSNFNQYFYIIYEFNEDACTSLKNESTDTRCRAIQSGIAYLTRSSISTFALAMIYSGDMLRFCGQGETQYGRNYGIDTYKINIRTQKAIPCNNAVEGDDEYHTDSISTGIKSITDMLNNLNGDDVNDPNGNFYTYTMYNQSAGGLTAYLSEIPIFLGGYYTEINIDTMEENRLNVDLIDNLYENAPGASLNNGDANYIYLERTGRDKLLLSVDSKRTIPEGAPSFNKICIAKIQTKNGKIIEGSQENFKINIGYNAYKFDAEYLALAQSRANEADKLTNAKTIEGINFDGTESVNNYAVCSTAADEQIKVVDCPNFVLTTGSRILVKFNNANTVTTPKLNVNDTGAKNIVYRGSTLSSGTPEAKAVYDLVYDGTNYQIIE